MGNTSRYSGNPEDLHQMGRTGTKQSVDAFVNPGTPENALVGMEDRKTGIVGGGASDRLKERLDPGANESWAMSKKSNGQEGALPRGK